jgi:hypothetical protein
MASATAAGLMWYLGDFRSKLVDEDAIQRGIAEALRVGDYEFEREARLSKTDRLDFLVGGVAIEVKRNGSLSQLLRQLARYAQHEKVRELLVVTARPQVSDLPNELCGKPLECLVLVGSLFG